MDVTNVDSVKDYVVLDFINVNNRCIVMDFNQHVDGVKIGQNLD